MYTGHGFNDWGIGDVDVLKVGDTYHLFHLVLPNHAYIAHATSVDGLNWKQVPNAAFVGGDGLSVREQALCSYARKLTREPEAMRKQDLAPLYAAGLDDATILDLNQIVAYFAYANRTVQGLGVNTDDETLGLHPDENREDFRHA